LFLAHNAASHKELLGWMCELFSEPHLTEAHMFSLATLIRDLDREMTSAHSGALIQSY